MPIQAVVTFAQQLKAFFARQDAAIDGIEADEKRQAEIIKQLQESPDTWTPADQTLLDELQTLTEAKTKRLEDLDTMLPPPVPQVPGPGEPPAPTPAPTPSNP